MKIHYKDFGDDKSLVINESDEDGYLHISEDSIYLKDSVEKLSEWIEIELSSDDKNPELLLEMRIARAIVVFQTSENYLNEVFIVMRVERDYSTYYTAISVHPTETKAKVAAYDAKQKEDHFDFIIQKFEVD